MNAFTLEIVTPEHQYLNKQVEKIVLNTDGGELTIFAHHIDLIADITICPLLVTSLNHDYHYALSGGTLRFLHQENKAIIFAFAIESSDEIDLNRASQAKIHAEELLSTAESTRDITRAEIKLKRALNRIQVKTQR